MFKVAQINIDSRDKDRWEEARRETRKILAEYATYIIAEVDDSQISNLEGKGFVVWERPEFRKIAVGDVEFEAEENREELGLASFGSDDDFYVLQFVGPAKPEWIEMLEKLGVDFRVFLSNNACVLKIGFHTIHQVTSIRNMVFIRFVTKYIPEFKISRELKGRTGISPLAESKTLKIVPESVPYNEVGNITVVLHDSAYASEVSRAIVELGGKITASGGDLFRVAIDPSSGSIEKIAEIKGVAWIERYVEPGPDLDKSAEIVEGNPARWRGHNLDGTGQIIAIADSGIDDTHPDVTGRIDRIYKRGNPADSKDYNGHGTHVTGIALGNGASSGGRIKGIAPGARLVFQALEGPPVGSPPKRPFGKGIPANYEDLFKDPYTQDTARIHHNSWGPTAKTLPGLYNSNSLQIDKFVWEQRDMVIVYTAGNKGRDAPPRDGVVDTPSINRGPGAAKNNIVVGSSENEKPGIRNKNGVVAKWKPPDFGTYGAPIKDDEIADDPEGMAPFSSRGPTQAGSVKPDLVAPGSSILSMKSSNATRDGRFGVSTDRHYMYLGGTSMAAPHVSGAAAIVRQYLAILKTKEEVRKKWRKRVKDPKINIATAALIKAILIHGAKKLEGQYPNPAKNDAEDHIPNNIPNNSVGRIPNNSQGFGRLDLEESLFPPAPTAMEIFDGYRVTTDEKREYQFLVQDITVPFKATLAWIDYHGALSDGGKLQNDLDLVVHTPDAREFHGNFVDPQLRYKPVDPGKNVDDKNNVEKVIIKNPATGIFRIVVRGDNVKSAINTPGGTGQEYALVISADLKETLKAIIGYPDNPGKLPGTLPWWKLCNKIRPLNPKQGDGPLVKHDRRRKLVAHLQTMLVDLGFDLGKTGVNKNGVDEIFGKLTNDGVKDFQDVSIDWEGNPLEVDRKVGPLTCDALNREMVGIWYDEYVAPLELTGETLVITATKRVMKKGVTIPPDPVKKIKVILKDPPTKHITLLDPYRNRFAFPDEGEYDVLDKDENLLLNGKMKSPDNIVIQNDVTPPFTVELELNKTFYTFYGEEK